MSPWQESNTEGVGVRKRTLGAFARPFETDWRTCPNNTSKRCTAPVRRLLVPCGGSTWNRGFQERRKGERIPRTLPSSECSCRGDKNEKERLCAPFLFVPEERANCFARVRDRTAEHVFRLRKTASRVQWYLEPVSYRSQ